MSIASPAWDYPQGSSDAVTKRWVNQQMKDGMKDLEELDLEMKQMQMTIKRMQMEYDTSIKDLTKKLMTVEDGKVDKSDYVSTNGGLKTKDLYMQKYHLLNLPLPRTGNEPITKALYHRLQQDLDALRVFVELKHA